jgi:type II secretory pathway component PulK
MRTKAKNNGSVLIVVVFAIALLTAFVAGMLQLNAEQIQIMKNEIFSAQRLQLQKQALLMRSADCEAIRTCSSVLAITTLAASSAAVSRYILKTR